MPLVSLLADGELGADEMRQLRPHLRSCLACRQRLRAFRDAPSRIAAVAPAGLLAGGGAHDSGPVRGLLEALLGSAEERAAATAGPRAAAGTGAASARPGE